MGWFWSDGPAGTSQTTWAAERAWRQSHSAGKTSLPSGCPMHYLNVAVLNPHAASTPTPANTTPASSCPVPHGSSSLTPSQPSMSHTEPTTTEIRSPSLLSQLNPLNFMFQTISQAPAPNQTHVLPTTRDESTIPKGTGDGNWEYPSPQQMYNALLRKGYTDTDITAVESMVAVHNFLNEGAWAEIVEWERRFGKGLWRGWEVSKRGEENAPMQLRRLEAAEGAAEGDQPTLMRFQGRPKDMTPKAAALQMLGKIFPETYSTEPPFDRHDWYVSRSSGGQQKTVRYVIDYYSGPPEPTGEPVFFLDVRPAATVTGMAERIIRWGCDLWWRASGGVAREAAKLERH